MNITARGVALAGLIAAMLWTGGADAQTSIAQKWVDGWNAKEPAVLVAAFTTDGVYQDMAFGITKKGSQEIRDLHKFFHDAVGGLYVKLVAAHVARGHGTIEWIFGGTDVGVFKTGRPFSVAGVSVIEVETGGSRATSTITMPRRS